MNCPSYEGCDASICPMEEQSVNNSIWYPDEPICTGRKSVGISLVRKQRKIARLKLNPDCFFTVNMLDTIKHVTKGLKGANPDKPNAEVRWLKHRNR